jgi:hypothetical protein
MDKAYVARISMIIRALGKETDQFRPKQEGEEVLRPEYPYLSIICVLMYLANNTRPDITFAVNCLARHTVTPTMHHWNDINNISRYLHGMIDLGLFFRKNHLIGYDDASYLSNPQNPRSQIGYMLLHGGTTIYLGSC